MIARALPVAPKNGFLGKRGCAKPFSFRGQWRGLGKEKTKKKRIEQKSKKRQFYPAHSFFDKIFPSSRQDRKILPCSGRH